MSWLQEFCWRRSRSIVLVGRRECAFCSHAEGSDGDAESAPNGSQGRLEPDHGADRPQSSCVLPFSRVSVLSQRRRNRHIFDFWPQSATLLRNTSTMKSFHGTRGFSGFRGAAEFLQPFPKKIHEFRNPETPNTESASDASGSWCVHPSRSAGRSDAQ